jgi:hypothetical protein
MVSNERHEAFALFHDFSQAIFTVESSASGFRHCFKFKTHPIIVGSQFFHMRKYSPYGIADIEF